MLPTLSKYRSVVIVAAAVFLLTVALRASNASLPQSIRAFNSNKENGANSKPKSRFMKASMLYGVQNDLFERAIDSHREHNEKFGYSMSVLRRQLSKGYWNKLAYLLYLITEELQKPAIARHEWILWTDPDVVLLNCKIPLDTFLPPEDDQWSHISLIGSRNNGLFNPGVFFIRVNEWAMKFLVMAMAIPMIEEDSNRGAEKDAAAMTFVFNNTDFGKDVFYEPRLWLNGLRSEKEFEGKAGDLLVQVSSKSGGEKWKALNDILSELSTTPEQYQLPLHETRYDEEVEPFWARVKEGMKVLKEIEKKVEEQNEKEEEDRDRNLVEAKDKLRETIKWEADREAAMDFAISKAKEFLK